MKKINKRFSLLNGAYNHWRGDTRGKRGCINTGADHR